MKRMIIIFVILSIFSIFGFCQDWESQIEGKWLFENFTSQYVFYYSGSIWFENGTIYADEGYSEVVGFYEILIGRDSNYFILTFGMWNKYCADLGNGTDMFIEGFGEQFAWEIQDQITILMRVPMLFWMTKANNE